MGHSFVDLRGVDWSINSDLQIFLHGLSQASFFLGNSRIVIHFFGKLLKGILNIITCIEPQEKFTIQNHNPNPNEELFNPPLELQTRRELGA